MPLDNQQAATQVATVTPPDSDDPGKDSQSQDATFTPPAQGEDSAQIEIKKHLEQNKSQAHASEPPVNPQPAPAQESPQNSAQINNISGLGEKNGEINKKLDDLHMLGKLSRELIELSHEIEELAEGLDNGKISIEDAVNGVADLENNTALSSKDNRLKGSIELTKEEIGDLKRKIKKISQAQALKSPVNPQPEPQSNQAKPSAPQGKDFERELSKLAREFSQAMVRPDGLSGDAEYLKWRRGIVDIGEKIAKYIIDNNKEVQAIISGFIKAGNGLENYHDFLGIIKNNVVPSHYKMTPTNDEQKGHFIEIEDPSGIFSLVFPRVPEDNFHSGIQELFLCPNVNYNPSFRHIFNKILYPAVKLKVDGEWRLIRMGGLDIQNEVSSSIITLGSGLALCRGFMSWRWGGWGRLSGIGSGKGRIRAIINNQAVSSSR